MLLGLVLEKVLKQPLCSPYMVSLTLPSCVTEPLVKKNIPRGHDGSRQIFEGLSYRSERNLFYLAPKSELACFHSFVHLLLHNPTKS